MTIKELHLSKKINTNTLETHHLSGASLPELPIIRFKDHENSFCNIIQHIQKDLIFCDSLHDSALHLNQKQIGQLICNISVSYEKNLDTLFFNIFQHHPSNY